ncbi:MAG: hypothetical protein ACI4I7_00520 [Oscillospiraceae bacterium]
MIAPVIIAMVLCLYYLGIGILFLCIDVAAFVVRLLAVVIPAVLTAVTIAVLVQRIKEIRKGEEDDLSKY